MPKSCQNVAKRNQSLSACPDAGMALLEVLGKAGAPMQSGTEPPTFAPRFYALLALSRPVLLFLVRRGPLNFLTVLTPPLFLPLSPHYFFPCAPRISSLVPPKP